MVWPPRNLLHLHHEWDALTLAALESDPPPENDFALAGWQELRRSLKAVIAGRYHEAPIDLSLAFERPLFVKVISWGVTELPDEEPSCLVLDKQWNARNRQLVVRILEGPSELSRTLGLTEALEVELKSHGLNGTWQLLEVQNLRQRPPIVIPAFIHPGVRSRVSGLALGLY